jgi:hypothetical protein
LVLIFNLKLLIFNVTWQNSPTYSTQRSHHAPTTHWKETPRTMLFRFYVAIVTTFILCKAAWYAFWSLQFPLSLSFKESQPFYRNIEFLSIKVGNEELIIILWFFNIIILLRIKWCSVVLCEPTINSAKIMDYILTW